jgi:hypothetical protein
LCTELANKIPERLIIGLAMRTEVMFDRCWFLVWRSRRKKRADFLIIACAEIRVLTHNLATNRARNW